MNLYLISQDENSQLDTFDALVVAAASEQDARSIHPDGQWGGHRWDVWASSPDKVTVKFLGVAAPGIEAGVILGSFNAG